MEIFLRVLQFLMKIVTLFLNPVMNLFWPTMGDGRRIPPIKNRVLTLKLHQVLMLLQQRELRSEELVTAYIKRIKEVNPFINAVVQDRFEDALNDAQRMDKTITSLKNDKLAELYRKRPLYGIPFTVKEAIGVKGMKQIVGSLNRIGEVTRYDGQTVSLLREAGAIPLLVSANPEFCFSIETFSYTNGKCLNGFDSQRSSGGSSGGEGALNGCGASLFGLGSDIAGSIRIPSLFNGIFGHKPTGGLTSIRGHFPGSKDPNCLKMLQIGPMTRFASDLSIILRIISGGNAELLNLDEPVNIKNVKIYYSLGFTGLNSLLRQPVNSAMEDTIIEGVKFFSRIGLKTEQVDFKFMSDSFEISLAAIARLKDFPYLLNINRGSKLLVTFTAFLRAMAFKTRYTKEGMIFEVMRRANAFMWSRRLKKYEEKEKMLRAEIIQLLGNDGVLFFPTFTVPAIPHGTSLLTLWNIDYTLLFNALGLPATHIPMGFDESGLPVGFQVISGPYNDKLCLKIAEMLDNSCGGWSPPSVHRFEFLP